MTAEFAECDESKWIVNTEARSDVVIAVGTGCQHNGNLLFDGIRAPT